MTATIAEQSDIGIGRPPRGRSVRDVGSGGWTAARLWANGQIRRGWAGFVVLGILAGVTAALSMSALAGARRTDTALERLRSESHAADAIVFATQVGVAHPDWSALRARPEVADLAVWDLMFGDMDGSPDSLLFVSHDGVWGDSVQAPVLTDGRMWNPTAPDEVVVVPDDEWSMPVGSTFTFQPFGADQGDDAATPTGPTVTFRVVGVGTTVNRFLFTSQIMVGPGFVAKYGDNVQLAENADVRLRDGAADIPALQRVVNEVVASGTPVLDLNAVSRRVDTSIEVERMALLLLAVAVASAGGLLVAQALGRSAGAIGVDSLALRALGLSRREMVAATVYSHWPVALGAAVVAAAGAVAASGFFPVGMGRKIDPHVGTHADLAVIGPGTLVVVVLVLGGVALAGRRSTRGEQGHRLRLSALVALIRSGAPVTVGVGASMALEAGSGRSRVAVRPALVGTIIGVLGVVGTLTVEHSIADALAHPERAGVTWDAVVGPLVTDYGPEGLTPAVFSRVAAAVPKGTGISEVARQVIPVDGVGVPTFMTAPYGVSDAPQFTVISGRSPTRDSEAAIGPKTSSDLGVGIGNEVTIGDERMPVTIVGIALFPPDVHAEFDEGLWLERGRFDRIAPPVDQAHVFDGAERAIFLTFPPGTDVTGAITATDAALSGSTRGVYPAELPVELTNLRNLRTLPRVLAMFLGVLAMAAVSHVLVTTAHRRRHDLAVMRAMGFTRRSSRRAVNAQATVIALVGALAGIPLGIVVGQIGWRLVAERVPLQNVAPVPALAIVVVAPLAVVLLNALALWPTRAVARLRPAELLRNE